MPTGPVSLAQRSSNPQIRGLIYGPSGVGKTVLVCGSQYFNTFVFDVDDGLDSAAAWKGNPEHGTSPTRRDHVLAWPIRTQQDFDQACQWLWPRIAQFQMVVVDTASELQRIVIKEVCDQRKIQVPDIPAWGAVLYVMDEIAQSFRHLPAHIFWTAHEVEGEDPELKRRMYRPYFQGAFGTSYGRHFSLIMRYTVSDIQVKDPATGAFSYVTQRALNCHLDAVTRAKDRSGGLDKWEVPNIDNILGKAIRAIAAHGEQPDA